MSGDLIQGGQAPDRALPIYIISEATLEHAFTLAKRLEGVKISSPEDFKKAGVDLNSVTKDLAAIDGKRLEYVGEYEDAKERNVNGPARPVILALQGAKKALQSQLQAWDRREREEKARADREREEQRLKAEQLRLEAERRKDVAVEKVEKAKTEPGFEKAATEFDKGVVKAAEAQEMLIASFAAPPVELTKAKEIASGMAVEELVVLDLSALPITYHKADEAKIKKHILDGTLTDKTPGIRFRLEKKFRGTGK